MKGQYAVTHPPLDICQFACRSDNYGYLLHDPVSKQTAAIDAPETGAIKRKLAEKGWALTHILNTHHHYDHVEANLALKEQTGCRIIGSRMAGEKIPGIDMMVSEGELVHIGGHAARVIETPGHTLGDITYHFERAAAAFTGDTLFSLGCGRLFEGSAAQMWDSLQKLMRLPPQTMLYCGHEYTLANAGFALEMEPENEALQEMSAKIRQLRQKGSPSIPTSLAQEMAANPFLRPDSPEIRRRLNMIDAETVEVFARIRLLKDQF